MRSVSRMVLNVEPQQSSLLQVLRERPDDRIAVANALVLKRPPLEALPPESELPMFVRLLHSHLHDLREQRRLLLPNLHDSETVAVFSDYGGDEKDSDYRTYSFLFTSFELAHIYLDDLRELRASGGLSSPRREMCFKELRYGPLGRALPRWLELSNQVPGLLFTLAVKKDTQSIFNNNTVDDLHENARTLQEGGFGTWDKKIAERALRIIHCIAYFAALLTSPKHKLWWMTDEDPIAPNLDGRYRLRKLFHQVLLKYHPTPHAFVGFSESFAKTRPAPEYDFNELLSLPDLAAGGLADFCTTQLRDASSVRTPKNKSVVIANWLGRQGLGLKKMQLVMAPAPEGMFSNSEGGYAATLLTIEPTGLDDVVFVPITL